MWIVLAAAAGASEAASEVAAPQSLQVGSAAFERRLEGGASHVYILEPETSEDLLITVEQQGIDVLVTVTGDRPPTVAEPAAPNSASPDEPLLELTVDAPNGRWGRETLLFSARDSAVYTIEISSSNDKASPGRYLLGLQSLQDAEPRVIAAHGATSEGSRLFRQGTSASRRLTLAKYEEAYALWQALDRRVDEAEILFQIAMLHRYLKQPREALTLHRRTLGLRQDLGDRRGQARSWLEIGSTAWSMGESRHSPGAYTKALELFRSLGDLHGQARALNYLGLVSARQDPRQALPFYEEALELFRRTGDTRQVGVVLNNLGGLQDQLGEPHAALERYRQALVIHEATGDVANLAVVWNNMGSTYRRTGRFQEALEYFERSLEVRRQLGDRRGEGRVLNNLGWASLRLGHLDRADVFLRQSLDVKRQAQDRRGEAVTLGNLGALAAERADWHQALTYYDEALQLHRTTGNRSGEATTLMELGRSTAELGRPQAAKGHLEEALVLLESLANPWRQGLANAALGEVLADFGQVDEGIERLEEALTLLRRSGDDNGILTSLLALARAKRQAVTAAAPAAAPATAAAPAGEASTGHLLAAWGHLDEALDLLDNLRTDLDAPGLRISFLSRHRDVFAQAIDLAMSLHALEPDEQWAARGLELSERSRARSLLDLLQETIADSHSAVDIAWVTEQRALLDRLNAKVERRRRFLKQGGREADVARLGTEIVQISGSLESLEDSLRRRSPQWRALTEPRPLDAPGIQALIDDDTVLLEYALGEERSFLWAVTRDDIQSYELADGATIEGAARRAHEALRVYEPGGGASTVQAMERLSRLLLAPLAERLQSQRLVVVADGATHYIPFAALPHPGRSAAPQPGDSGSLQEPLLVHHEIVVLPSASVLGLQREVAAEPSVAPSGLVVFADPVFSAADPRVGPETADAGGSTIKAPAEPDASEAGVLRGHRLSRLAWSDWEAQAIMSHADAEESLLALGFDASLQAIEQGALRNRRIVHFATHGMIDSEHPELSALAFSMTDVQGRPRPGLLRLPEIYNLDLDADLVVLSGCRTALGSEVHGEGLVGLARGFFAAGARRLVASLWRVQDKATAELMDRFYERLLADSATRLRPAAALREAQLELLRSAEYGDPYHWAAFALYGDWR